MRSLSANTHLFTLSVLTCTLFLCTLFFYEPNTDFFETTTNVTKVMKTVGSSDLQIDFEIKTISREVSNDISYDVINEEIVSDVSEDIAINSDEVVSNTEDITVTSYEDSNDSNLSESKELLAISLAELDELCKLVQAEANTEDLFGRTMVANVVLNRVNSVCFDNDILSVIHDPGQFDPVSCGSFKRVEVTHETREAVINAIINEDITDGALYFQKSKSQTWGDKEYLYRYGSHSFYR